VEASDAAENEGGSHNYRSSRYSAGSTGAGSPPVLVLTSDSIDSIRFDSIDSIDSMHAGGRHVVVPT
jgi:hypothetical protein